MTITSTVTVCLWYDGRAEEAARLHTSLVPNSEITSVSRILADRPAHPAGTAGRFGSAGSGSRAAGNAADDEDRYRSAQGRVQWRMSALPQPHDNRMWVSPASGPESLTDPRSDENVTTPCAMSRSTPPI